MVRLRLGTKDKDQEKESCPLKLSLDCRSRMFMRQSRDNFLGTTPFLRVSDHDLGSLAQPDQGQVILTLEKDSFSLSSSFAATVGLGQEENEWMSAACRPSLGCHDSSSAKTGLQVSRHPFLSHGRCPRALREALGLEAETIGKETNRRSRIHSLCCRLKPSTEKNAGDRL